MIAKGFCFLTMGTLLLMATGCERKGGTPAVGELIQGSLDTAQLMAFFEDQTTVDLPEPPDFGTTAYKYFNDAGTVRGYTDLILKTKPEAAQAILEEARSAFKQRHLEQGGIHFEYRNYVVANYGGMTIPEDAPVLYWDDGDPTGEQIHLQIDPDSGVIRLAYSIGVERDDLAKKAAAERTAS